ncbi:ImuA family protein [Prosthecodimorpha staleyi]|uniref:Inducible mutagenesis protein A n=1 Tax=Prosthecodimorpha staleyi TaxID=2840188 RepID=A0A947GJ45_9HYPH|nr:inducible mutagenesis protein A [Prosthecodimorpha staleyi]MBT9290869.1 inducible mutagenesis protein A [Prosthecodimorpha staleyi]
MPAPGPHQSPPAGSAAARLALPFGVPGLDGLFRAGGLPLGVLHELTAEETRETGALAGFAAALAARQAAFRAGMVVWAADRQSPREGGRLYAPGLHALGLDPGRVLFVDAADPADVLWVLEEALATRGIAAVLGEIRGNPRALDLTATRRLALRARDRPVLGLILRVDAAAEASAAATRWTVASGPAGTLGGFAEGVGRPVWRLDLTKNREGHLGRFELEWDHHDRRFARPAPHPVARPDPAADRPADPRRTGQVVAFGRAS